MNSAEQLWPHAPQLGWVSAQLPSYVRLSDKIKLDGFSLSIEDMQHQVKTRAVTVSPLQKVTWQLESPRSKKYRRQSAFNISGVARGAYESNLTATKYSETNFT